MTGATAGRHTHSLRAAHDGILVGMRTWLVDSPSLTTRLVPGRSPKRFVLTSGQTRGRKVRHKAHLVLPRCCAPRPACPPTTWTHGAPRDTTWSPSRATCFRRHGGRNSKNNARWQRAWSKAVHTWPRAFWKLVAGTNSMSCMPNPCFKRDCLRLKPHLGRPIVRNPWDLMSLRFGKTWTRHAEFFGHHSEHGAHLPALFKLQALGHPNRMGDHGELLRGRRTGLDARGGVDAMHASIQAPWILPLL